MSSSFQIQVHNDHRKIKFFLKKELLLLLYTIHPWLTVCRELYGLHSLGIDRVWGEPPVQSPSNAWLILWWWRWGGLQSGTPSPAASRRPFQFSLHVSPPFDCVDGDLRGRRSCWATFEPRLEMLKGAEGRSGIFHPEEKYNPILMRSALRMTFQQ